MTFEHTEKQLYEPCCQTCKNYDRDRLNLYGEGYCNIKDTGTFDFSVCIDFEEI